MSCQGNTRARGESVSLSEALNRDTDMIHRLTYFEKRKEFFYFMYQRLPEIKDLVSWHLKIPQSAFTLGRIKEWIHGSFNLCIPIHVTDHHSTLPSKLYLRLPLPYRVGEEHFPGNANEKLRCEAATYIWLQRTTDIPIPHLLAFGFPGTLSFTAIKNEPLHHRLLWYFRYAVTWLFGSILPPYFSHRRRWLFDVGYLIIEHVDQGKMLSESWKEHRSDPDKRENLFRGLSRIMLSLAKCPLPRIGSWTMDDQGLITLTNRPLAKNYHMRENARIPTNIPRALTYTSTLPYYMDLLHVLDNCLRHQPNSIHNEYDGKWQMAALAGMRTVLPLFTNRELRDGPFVLTLTDLHQSNIFVDDEWNITKLIDLEWACSRPIEMLCPPLWLTDQGPDEIINDDPDELYPAMHREFVDVLRQEEIARYNSAECADLMTSNLKSGAFWYLNALLYDLSTMVAMFSVGLSPTLTWEDPEGDKHFDDTASLFWDRQSIKFLGDKIKEQEAYNERLRQIFADAAVKKAAEEGPSESTADHLPTASHSSIGALTAENAAVEADATSVPVVEETKQVKGQTISDHEDMVEGGQTENEEA
ncbi:hypothetical protein K461DRAFT_314663 [Myriangium duriaei CBS 260.36]|uniref:Aminoglycoside phosphotransferase domain-containing protein n=1 Tax=Myriangium duriaei CBS 260.36 TaxID=1168546 RepID=A0A9P4J1I7_9PEZI|nr:hypothetical protein K461DRAFT_314663 [Myriangium duriaei CBS 260.36]